MRENFLKYLYGIFTLLVSFCGFSTNFSCIEKIEKDLLQPKVIETDFGSRTLFSSLHYDKEVTDIKNLRFTSYNISGLLRSDTSPQSVKEFYQGKSKVLQEINSDIIFLQEVENSKALNNFAKEQLNNSYFSHVMKASEGGINLGILVKKDLPLAFEVRSYNKLISWYYDRKVPAFLRGLQVLIIKDLKTKRPLFAVSHIHLKSKRGEDPFYSYHRRQIEANSLTRVMRRLKREFLNLPMLIVGDFNSSFFSPMFASLRQDFQSIFQALPGKKIKDKTTHITFEEGRSIKTQVDYILANKEISNKKALVEMGIYRYKNEHGDALPYPENFEQRNLNPSDHYPIWAEFDFQALLSQDF